MSLILRNRSLPTVVSDFFDTGRVFRPSIFDFDGDMLDLDETSVVIPDANIEEGEKEFKIELAAPGLEKKDFKVEVNGKVITISAEKKEEKKENGKNFKRREFSYNSFSRSFTLPENSMPEKVDAKYENGILRLLLPKKEITISKPKKEIKVS
jgi:HSP20 family protein